jgi:hypothetical protein
MKVFAILIFSFFKPNRMFSKCTWRNAGIALLAVFACPGSVQAQNCNCAVTIPLTQQSFNASSVAPGDTICLQAGVRTRNLLIRKVKGTPANKVVIINCGGKVTLSLVAGLSYGIKFDSSEYFQITGTGSADTYGIVVDSAAQGMQLGAYSTNFEVDHLEIKNSGFAGIMAKTDNSGRAFVMRNVKFHHNYMHDQRTGEGFYIGHFNWQPTGDQHDIDTLELYDNITERTGREGIQVGCTFSGKAKIYNNKVYAPGLENIVNQRSGVQLGNGFSGSFYNNYIEGSPANGITVLGVGNVFVYNNVIVNPGELAIYSGHATSQAGKHFYYINNTILMGSTQPVIRFDPTVACTAYIQNNAIVRNATDTAFDRMSGTMVVAGNVIRTTSTPFNFENPSMDNYDILTGSVAINAGVTPTGVSIPFDFENRTRPVGNYDAGAYEFQAPPGVLYRVNAGGLEVADTPIPWEKDKQTDPCDWLDPASPNTTTGSDLPWSGTNTTDAPSQIFSTNRYASFGGTQVNYNFPVSNGTYEVRLYFAENTHQASGLRVFDVLAEGTVRMDNFDIYAAAGYRNAHKATLSVTVSDGILDLDFVNVTGNPQINGIAIVSGGSGSTTRPGQLITELPATGPGKIMAYPVPLQNNLYIQRKGIINSSLSNEEVEVRLMSETGLLLYKAKHRFSGSNLNPVNLSPLALKPGVYFLKLTGTNTNEVIRLLKR